MKFISDQGLTTHEINHAWHQQALTVCEWSEDDQLKGLWQMAESLTNIEKPVADSPYIQIPKVLGRLLIIEALSHNDPILAQHARIHIQEILINQAKKIAYDVKRIKPQQNRLFTSRYPSAKSTMNVSDVLFNVIQGNMVIQSVPKMALSRYTGQDYIYINPDMEQAIIYPHRLMAARKGILSQNTFMPQRIDFLLNTFHRACNHEISELDARRLLTLMDQTLVANYTNKTADLDPLIIQTAKVFIDFSVEKIKKIPNCTSLLNPELWPPEIREYLFQKGKTSVCKQMLKGPDFYASQIIRN